MTHARGFTLLSLVILAGCISGFARQTRGLAPGDSLARVPVLDRYHEVIFVVWHDAWPKRDTEKLASLLPAIQSGADSIAAATLPGILREKKAAWASGVEALRSAVKGYAEAAAGKDSARLMEAAENLHARYEALVRVIRPVLKEIDDFHATLYVLYHSYLPAYALDNITRAAGDLKRKMTLLDGASVPERYKNRSDAFHAARKDLGAAVASLNAAVVTRNEPVIRAAVEEVHARYEALTRVFEQ